MRSCMVATFFLFGLIGVHSASGQGPAVGPVMPYAPGPVCVSPAPAGHVHHHGANCRPGYCGPEVGCCHHPFCKRFPCAVIWNISATRSRRSCSPLMLRTTNSTAHGSSSGMPRRTSLTTGIRGSRTRCHTTTESDPRRKVASRDAAGASETTWGFPLERRCLMTAIPEESGMAVLLERSVHARQWAELARATLPIKPARVCGDRFGRLSIPVLFDLPVRFDWSHPPPSETRGKFHDESMNPDPAKRPRGTRRSRSCSANGEG